MDKKIDRLQHYGSILYFPISIIYLESVFKIAVFKELLNIGFIYMILFSIPVGILLYLVCSLFNSRANRILSVVLTVFLTFIYIVQAVYYQIFSTFLTLFSLNGTEQVLQFWQEVMIAAKNKAITILFLLTPIIFLLIFRNLFPERKPTVKFKGILAGVMVGFQVAATILVSLSNTGELSTSFLYSKAVIPDLSVNRFGMLTTSRLDVKHLVFGFTSTDDGGEKQQLTLYHSAKQSEENAKKPTPEQSYNSSSDEVNSNQDSREEYNTINLDFDNLIAGEKDTTIAAMHRYFKSVQPTKKNKYTGMFKGKNLIMITAEGFSPYAVNKELTPTLYKMSQEGFRFTNFYTPIWGVSTSDGEYVACNSLIPKPGIWSFYVSGRNYMPFCMGNQLKKLGYGTRAYHDHSYTYYHRDVSHPNMGYTFKAVGNGLEMKKSWPESDLEMIQKTADDYIGKTPFHTYYMTVSGHLMYTFNGNAMADKNRELVKNLSYSSAVKAYLACNIEFDRAMGELIDRLEKSGLAEDTLIAISPDHYPYGLTNSEISELAGHPVETNFELYKGIFILWSKGIKSEEISKPCASLDILPTISNLMGVEYDSRLLMGRDILSDAQPLVVFSNWSWLTDKARYNSKSGKFILAEGETKESVSKQYRTETAQRVNDMFKLSAKILETNYYNKVLR
ncbi:sulfatase [Ruminiclostridium papyrosolvens DSM 2782]|uniref:Sulfatase n=1 Tax=Ruminiclostridium papyrosolvens DSM 2782 TaxID=588581 RepID=F1T9S0_9FIRM|nr:alkaline phosphatase family protein [Ruminiclostridium papyrosolvens]EGD48662.1 sulfatase [Ruminiclostridium papyrosolvens DSM 2782]WES32580.1 sulfatase-like hydrolase/transferase [Ruminiclostridium papyrosolvens DSM 2782]